MLRPTPVWGVDPAGQKGAQPPRYAACTMHRRIQPHDVTSRWYRMDRPMMSRVARPKAGPQWLTSPEDPLVAVAPRIAQHAWPLSHLLRSDADSALAGGCEASIALVADDRRATQLCSLSG